MAPVLETVIDAVIDACETDEAETKTAEKHREGFSLDTDSDDDEVIGVDVNLNFLDEKASALHCLGNLAVNCSGVIQPYMERICKTLDDLTLHFHENIRYHVCQTYAQICIGLLRFNTNKADSDD